jgi:hypothetical protein
MTGFVPAMTIFSFSIDWDAEIFDPILTESCPGGDAA